MVCLSICNDLVNDNDDEKMSENFTAIYTNDENNISGENLM